MGGSDQAKICEQLGANGEAPRHVRLPTLVEGHCSPVRREHCLHHCRTVAAMTGKSDMCTHTVTWELMPCGACAAPLEYDYLFSENGLVAYKDGKVMVRPLFRCAAYSC